MKNSGRSSAWQRKADFLLGVPLIYVLSLFKRRRRTLPADPRRIVLMQVTAIGDSFLTSGIVVGLIERYPAAEIVILHGPNGPAMALFERRPKQVETRYADLLATARRLRQLRPDLVIDLTAYPRATPLLAYFSGARCTIGFCTEGESRHRLFDIPVEHGLRRHELDNLAMMAQTLGLSRPYRMRLRADWPPVAELDAAELILVHPWPGGANRGPKQWPRDNWIALIRALCDEGGRVAITGATADIAASAELADATGLPPERCFSIAARFDLEHLASLIHRAALVISVDTGIMQLASAVDARLIALHGPTLSSRWGPRNANAIAIDATHPAAGYVSLGYEQHPQADEIMSTISVEHVLAAARIILARAPACRRAAPAESTDPP